MTTNAGDTCLTETAPGHARCAAVGDVEVRHSRPADRDAILQFVAEMGFNPREPQTWDGLGMSAMTAWDGARLVGAIPLEPRCWQLRPASVVSAVHETTVGVLPEFQGRGIGSLMQDAICTHEPPLAEIATVFREDQTSPAYRWYRRNGFGPAARVSAWLLDEPKRAAPSVPMDVLDASDPAIDWAAIDQLWHSARADRHGGFVCRARRPLREWLGVHPYRGRYSFRVLLLHDAAGLAGYAVLGIGRLHSKTTRVEIMEHATREKPSNLADELCRAAVAFAQEHDYRPLRWAMAAGDPDAIVAQQHGFRRNWEFDLLWRPLPSCKATLPDATERTRLWRYHSLDYA